MAGVFNIPLGYSFLDSLAQGLLKREEKDPLSFSQTEIFLPTRRACLELKQAFLRHTEGKCLLLPKLTPLGDLAEEDESLKSFQDEVQLAPLIPPLKRQGLLTQLVNEYMEKSGVPSSPSLALKLAKSLIKLMDQATIENVSWAQLAHLVPEEFASHWQLTLDFLDIITTHWPQILEEKGFIEPYVRHHQLVDMILLRWEKNPPLYPILAAGSTGTMPATARLLQAIAMLPEGSLILPGVDSSLMKEEAEALSPCHPQYALVCLLKKMELSPSEIHLWPGLEGQEEKGVARARCYEDAMKPSFSSLKESPDKALDNLYYVPCATPQEEALVIAILLRQQLDIPDQRTALVTADLKLVERVTWELKRWGIEIDRSSGESFDQTPPGVFLNLCVDCATSPQNAVALLSVLKHPLFHMGMPLGRLRSEIRLFEKKSLRGNVHEIPSWLRAFYERMAPLKDFKKTSFETILRAHIDLCEGLSTDEKGVCQLWKGGKGESIQSFLETLKEAASDYPDLTLSEYALIFKELMEGQKVRFRPQKHPRLSILGPLEARLFHADVMILGGLNEGSWPPDGGGDPWLNRPMRRDMGFSPLERRIGLSSHDFGQAFTSEKVYLTRSLKIDGTPTVMCRWLERLEVYLKAWGLSLPEEPRVREWSRQLDQPGKQGGGAPPFPTPPVSSRPRRLSVTQVETWMRDPYALYARHILALSSLDPLNVQVDQADRGTLIHAALDQFFRHCPCPHDKYAHELLLFIGKTLFEPYQEDPSVRLFWWPRFGQIARWFIDIEKKTRQPGTKTFTEVKGKLTFTTPQGPFECTAKADRIDLLPDGRLRILDYKTGLPPADQDVCLGFSPQLPLEGAIAMQQGFEGIKATRLESLQYWWLKGGTTGGVIRMLPGDPHDLSAEALSGLKRMVHLFEEETTSYPAAPLPSKALRYNDYAHLARFQEWRRQ